MSRGRCKIGVVAPASRMSPDVATRVLALAERLYPDRTPEIIFHPQCFASHGHFAGDDETRAWAFLEIANDESYDAVWFARGATARAGWSSRSCAD
jgi:muramoyltetrapeptide carboxypeptidase